MAETPVYCYVEKDKNICFLEYTLCPLFPNINGVLGLILLAKEDGQFDGLIPHLSEIFYFGQAEEEEDSYVRFNNLMSVGGRLVVVIFFWQGDEHKKKYRLARWHILCQPKEQGELGIQNIDAQNNATVADNSGWEKSGALRNTISYRKALA
ncbi:hypothetical protein ACJX0J_027089 [Zea mays]